MMSDLIMKTIDFWHYSESNKKEIASVIERLNDQLAQIMVLKKIPKN